jgi:hypothetical protein
VHDCSKGVGTGRTSVYGDGAMEERTRLSGSEAKGVLDEVSYELSKGYEPIQHSDRGCQYCPPTCVKRASVRDVALGTGDGAVWLR